MGFVKEFKEFAMRGNVIDMAVGVVIGGAFGKIVSFLSIENHKNNRIEGSKYGWIKTGL